MNSDRITAAAVSALRTAGAMVMYLDPEGGNGRGGMPDLLVTHPRCGVRLLEMKSPGGRLNDAQRDWHARWVSSGGPAVVVCHSVEDALRACGLL
jgi:hypothetical protein